MRVEELKELKSLNEFVNEKIKFKGYSLYSDVDGFI